ncbi:MAG: serine acetyltransferase [Ruminococcus sp.]
MNMKDEKNLYFTSKKNYIKCCLLKEQEYYLWRFQKLLRKEERSHNLIIKSYFRFRKNVLGRKLGLTIPAGVFDEGLRIWHYGSVVVNPNARVGKNCRLHGGNVIGNNGRTMSAPHIGDNVDIGAGAIIIGDVTIADGVKIGAGAVVVSSCMEAGSTLVGVPARKTNYKKSS